MGLPFPAGHACRSTPGRTGDIGFKEGFGFVAIMGAACVFAVLVSQIFVDRPLVLLLVVSLLIFLSFLLLARGEQWA